MAHVLTKSSLSGSRYAMAAGHIRIARHDEVEALQ